MSCQMIPGGALRCPHAAFGRNSVEGHTTAVGATTQALEAERLVMGVGEILLVDVFPKRCEWPPSGVEVVACSTPRLCV